MQAGDPCCICYVVLYCCSKIRLVVLLVLLDAAVLWQAQTKADTESDGSLTLPVTSGGPCPLCFCCKTS